MRKTVKYSAAFRFLTLALCAAVFVASCRPASADVKRDISYKVAGFYKWYVGQIKADKVPTRNRAMIRKYSSQRLYRWLHSKAYEEYGADYFLSAQDFGDDWDQARVSNLKIKGRIATLKVTLGRPHKDQRQMGQRTLDLKLVKESGAWKIDRVNGD